MAAAEKISPSYISRVMRLTFLSPTTVEAVLDGRQPAHLTMKELLEPFPLDWKGKAEQFSVHGKKPAEFR